MIDRVLHNAIVLLFSLSLTPAWAAERDLPTHPREIEFPPLQYDPPQRLEYRHELEYGVVAYLVEDHDLPLITVSVLLRAGSYLDPLDKIGLADATASVMRSGGAASWDAEGFDEEADFLAANIFSSMGDTSGSALLNTLSKDIDPGFDLFFGMLQQPRFQADRLELYKSQVIQRMERRNDSTGSIERREWERLMRGLEHFSTRVPTRASIQAITVDDLREFHRKHWHPANFILAVSGDFDTQEMKAKLNERLRFWDGSQTQSPPIPEPNHIPEPGVYLVDKTDVNQGRVALGHLGLRLGHPDQFAVTLMNDILGGSGFTSRITNRVRSDEGLAYSAGSSFSFGVHYPGFFRAAFQSKSSTCAEAAAIILEEIERIRSQPVSEEELETVRAGAIEIFPRFFASAAAVARTFANDELIGRDPDYWNDYRDNLRAVTREDVQRVAREHLHPDRVVILAVGKVDEMLAGNADRPQYTFPSLAPQGRIIRIPLPDPMTMEYPEQ